MLCKFQLKSYMFHWNGTICVYGAHTFTLTKHKSRHYLLLTARERHYHSINFTHSLDLHSKLSALRILPQATRREIKIN